MVANVDNASRELNPPSRCTNERASVTLLPARKNYRPVPVCIFKRTLTNGLDSDRDETQTASRGFLNSARAVRRVSARRCAVV